MTNYGYELGVLRSIVDGTEVALRCDMTKDCKGVITHIDAKGYLYCAHHGQERKASVRCRRMTKEELAHLRTGEALIEY